MPTHSQTTNSCSMLFAPDIVHVSVISGLTQRSPAHPGEMDWSKMYPAFVAEGQDDAVEKEAITEQDGQVVKALTASKRLTKDVEVADIGCGFGGLLMALAPTMPGTLCLG